MDTRYQRGKIYKITSPDTDQIYIGSTTEPTLARRLATHRADHRRWLAGKRNYVTSFAILERAEYSIILLESYPCESKDELHAREQHYIDMHAGVCVNMHKAHTGLTPAEYHVQYRETNRDALNSKARAPHVCDCGGRCTHANVTRHSRTQTHQAYLKHRQSLIDDLIAKYGDGDWAAATVADMEYCIELYAAA